MNSVLISEPVLIVIDMQAGFPAACDQRTRLAVAREIREAMRLGCPIIFVECRNECNDYGPTFPELTGLTAGYEHVAICEKPSNSGADAIATVCRERGFDPVYFLACGINTGACVKETVVGLKTLFPDCVIDIIEDACNAVWSGRKDVPRIFSGIPGVTVTYHSTSNEKGA